LTTREANIAEGPKTRDLALASMARDDAPASSTVNSTAAAGGSNAW